VPYFAIVVDAEDIIGGFILPMSHLLVLFPKGKTASGWKMTEQYLKRYERDPEIRLFDLKTETTKWWTAYKAMQPTRYARS